VQFVQAPGYVVIVTEMIHDARIVPLDARPHGTLRRWMGDPRGHWDGDTLVVDGINVAPEYSFRGSSAHLHLIERFTRTAPDTIEYAFTVDDPTVWSHEGNDRSLSGMLKGARFAERQK
jgi:hypothetical protein